MAAILEVRNLTHTYSAGTPFEHKALNDVSYDPNPLLGYKIRLRHSMI